MLVLMRGDSICLVTLPSCLYFPPSIARSFSEHCCAVENSECEADPVALCETIGGAIALR